MGRGGSGAPLARQAQAKTVTAFLAAGVRADLPDARGRTVHDCARSDPVRALLAGAAPRQADIEQLARIAATYPSQERFLTELTLDPPDATSGEAGAPLLDEDYLILSTIHSAKGREWSSVSILNVIDGCIPSDLATGSEQEIDEERRLLYVAMTRAKDHLELMLPQRFYVSGQAGSGDRHVYANRTRFIPNRLLACFASSVWPQPSPQTAAGDAPARPPSELAARLLALLHI